MDEEVEGADGAAVAPIGQDVGVDGDAKLLADGIEDGAASEGIGQEQEPAAVGDEGLQGGDLFGGVRLGGEGEDANVVLGEQREGERGGPVGGDLVSFLAEPLSPIPVGLVNGVSAVLGVGDHPVRFVKQDPAPLCGRGVSRAGTEPGRDACQDQGKGHNSGG